MAQSSPRCRPQSPSRKGEDVVGALAAEDGVVFGRPPALGGRARVATDLALGILGGGPPAIANINVATAAPTNTNVSLLLGPYPYSL